MWAGTLPQLHYVQIKYLQDKEIVFPYLGLPCFSSGCYLVFRKAERSYKDKME